MSEKSLNFVCWREDEVTRGLPCDKKEMRQSLYNKPPPKTAVGGQLLNPYHAFKTKYKTPFQHLVATVSSLCAR